MEFGPYIAFIQFIATIAAVPLLVVIVIWLKFKSTIKRQNKIIFDEQAAVMLIEQHAQTLARKKRQCTYTDDYGAPVIKGWDREITYFRENILRKTLADKAYILDLMDSDMAIERAIAKCPPPIPTNFSYDMTPQSYERMCADILVANGWNARTTKSTGDQGVDVIADRDGIKLVVQCKLYSNPIGNGAIQEIFAAKAHERAHHAAVVTNAGYTSGARQLANTTGVELLHHENLAEWAASLLMDFVDISNEPQTVKAGSLP